ncbi:MAG: DUF3516 domain-containing protein [bacterium]
MNEPEPWRPRPHRPLHPRRPAGSLHRVGLRPRLRAVPHQEEAVLEVMAGKHVVLNTPTGSGKSLVALALHFHAFATGRSVYTSPIKALVSEKFFELCRHFGAENVGMLTGDATINPKAPVIACTEEILAAMALAEGDAASVHAAVLDEFPLRRSRPRHGVADPLLTLRRTRFLLLSATLGDMKPICEDLERRTGLGVSLVQAVQRPVPLAFEYREDPLHETLQDLFKHRRAPVYVVNFTQKACAELAQSLTSLDFCSSEEKKAIADDLKGERFDSPYGKDVARYIRHGMGLHHAGLLPRYRLLVERLAQAGRLKLIIGTDTLGVGINVPIRTVLFTRLCKYDGRKTSILSVRDFKQIAGRAGRKGFDDQGYVVCQAPEHVIENKRALAKVGDDKARRRKLVLKKAPEFGYAHWDETTFERLITSDSEALQSQFEVDHGMLVNLLQRGEPGRRGGYGLLIELIGASHEHAGRKRRLRREAKAIFQQLRDAKVIELARRPGGRGQTVTVAPELQHDFSLYHSLSLFLVHAVGRLDPDADDFPEKTLSLAEAILEDPQAILRRQQDKLRTEAYQQLKAEGVEYDERQEILEKITWPMPDADYIFEVFDAYARARPWVKVSHLRPKSVARDMFSRYCTFNQYVKDLGLERWRASCCATCPRRTRCWCRTCPRPEDRRPGGSDLVPAAGAPAGGLQPRAHLGGHGRRGAGGGRRRPPHATASPRHHEGFPQLPGPRPRRAGPAGAGALLRLRGGRGHHPPGSRGRLGRAPPQGGAGAVLRRVRPAGLRHQRPAPRPHPHGGHGAAAVARHAVAGGSGGDGFWFIEGAIDLTDQLVPEGPMVAILRIDR